MAIFFRNEPPSKGVLAVNINFVKVKRPISYKLIWPPLNFGGASSFVDNNSQQDASISFPVENDSENLVCSIWFPIAPQGYVSMGCVVSVDKREPPSSSCLCILSSLVSPCSFKDCISLSLSEPYVFPQLIGFQICLYVFQESIISFSLLHF